MQEHNWFEDEQVVEYQAPKPQPRIDQLYCLRCGHRLGLTAINESTLVEYYYCTNKSCVHANSMLEFKNQVYVNRGPGESYSLCWEKLLYAKAYQA